MNTLATSNQANSIHTAQKILSVVLRYSNQIQLPGFASGLHPVHFEKVLRAVKQKRPLHLILPAFPAKSPNREKTAGALPDFAEVLGLERLHQICQEISQLHLSGTKLTICSDGRVFSDLVNVEEREVSAYRDSIEKIIAEFNFHSLATFQLEDAFAIQDFSRMRNELVQNFGPSLDEIKLGVKTQARDQFLFNGIHRFLFEDALPLSNGKSRNRVREEAKEITYQVIQRSNSWSAFVEEKFPEALRLSIHPQFGESKKIGMQLVDCENSWGTPWHNVAVQSSKGFFLTKRKIAESLGAERRLAHGKYTFFSLQGSSL